VEPANALVLLAAITHALAILGTISCVSVLLTRVGPIIGRGPFSILWRDPVCTLSVGGRVVDVVRASSARVFFAEECGDSMCCRRGSRLDGLEQLSRVSWMPFGPSPTAASPHRYSHDLLLAAGAEDHQECDLAVERRHRARVRSEAGHAVAGSFRSAWLASEGRAGLPNASRLSAEVGSTSRSN